MLVPKEKKSSINGGITVDPGKVRVPNPPRTPAGKASVGIAYAKAKSDDPAGRISELDYIKGAAEKMKTRSRLEKRKKK